MVGAAKNNGLPVGDFDVVDLTHSLTHRHPHLPSDPPFQLTQAAVHTRDGYQDHRVEMQEHSGTHVDAASHFCDGGQDVASIDPTSLIGPLCIVDVRDAAAADSDYGVVEEDLVAWERQHGTIPDRAIVMMCSGWDTRFDNPVAFLGTDESGVNHFPSWSESAASFLIQRNVAAIGVDTFSIDVGPSTNYPVHRLWLRDGRWAIENVANLASLPPTGATAIVGLPKVAGATGFPARILALVPTTGAPT